MNCNVCHKPLTKRGNRQFWIRSNYNSRVVIVCGRVKCQQAIRDEIAEGEVYSYTTVNTTVHVMPV